MSRRTSRRNQNRRHIQGARTLTSAFQYDRLELRQLLAGVAGREDYQPAIITDAFARDAVTVDDMIVRASVRSHIANQLVVAVESPVPKSLSAGHLAGLNWKSLTGRANVSVLTNLMTVDRPGGKSVSLIHLDLGPGADLATVMRRLDLNATVLWSSPNFSYDGPDPRELTPNDPSYGSQYHHTLMKNNLAWDITLGNPAIKIGVTDDGVDRPHVDLNPNIWVNPGEIAGNSVDDDGNGFIDDINGWDFSSNNNDPNPNGANDHGTHVAGIAAGRTNNGIGIAGTAGLATIVPMQFYLGTSGWTAAIINTTYRYAADNHFQIVTTSYNVDSWVGDAVFLGGLQYMYDGGVLHFNSAGNNNELNPARQIFDQSIFVSSTDSGDIKSSFSNYGTGVDVAAPGSNIFSTILSNGYGTKSGTSMSTPNAAGAAALIWGANPGWNRDQVAARLLFYADNIDGLNPTYAGLLGTGRVNPFASISNALPAPRVKSLTGLPAAGSTSTTWNFNSFTVAFNQIMDPASVNNSGSFVLREAGPDGTFGNGDDRLVGLTAAESYMIGNNQLTFSINGAPLEPGKYQLSLVSGGLQNPFGTDLDGNSNGVGGDDFTYQFTLEPAINKLPTQGSQVHQQAWSGNISAVGQLDDFYIELDAGQTLTAIAQATGVLVPTLVVRNPSGTILTSVTGSGANAFTVPVSVATAGRYRITIGGNAGTTGLYNAQILLNSAIEAEEYGGATNNTQPAAQSLLNSSLALGTLGADRLAVTGRLPSTGGGTTFVADGFETGSLGAQWTSSSSAAGGRIQITGAQGTAAGSFAMLMDTTTSGTNIRNQADWTVNLSGLTAATLQFSHSSYGDETHTMPVSFAGTSNTDGVAISANGTNWFRVWSPTATQTAAQWFTQTIDLAAAASAAGISLGANFKIRFQQYDNNPIPSDGRGYDSIAVLVPAPPEDWYSFTLADGQSAALAASRTGATGSVNVELYNSAGALLRTGVAATNISSYISRYQDATSNGTADTYFARVTGSNADYTLAVTRRAEFDREANDLADSTAQDIGGLVGAAGFATTTPDFYRFVAAAGEQISFSSHLPGGGPNQFVNGLSSGGPSLLTMQLVAPGGSTVASGSTGLTFTATTAGTYYLRVAAASGSGGEYFVQRDPVTVAHVESGTVVNVNETGAAVTFAQAFTDPIVIVSPATNASPFAVVASVSNVSGSGFTVRLKAWKNDSEVPFSETVRYLVVERGTIDLGGGAKLIADRSTVEDQFGSYTYASGFGSAPAVVPTLNIPASQPALTTRLRNVGTAGFEARTQQEELPNFPVDLNLTVYYLAMTPGRYTLGGWTIEAGLTANAVTHSPFTVNFLQPFADIPVFTAQMQTYNESDPAVLRQTSLSATSAGIYLDEETTLDPETNHAAETIGYIAARNSAGFAAPPGGPDGGSGIGPGGAWSPGTPGGADLDGTPGVAGRAGNGLASGVRTGSPDRGAGLSGSANRLAGSHSGNARVGSEQGKRDARSANGDSGRMSRIPAGDELFGSLSRDDLKALVG